MQLVFFILLALLPQTGLLGLFLLVPDFAIRFLYFILLPFLLPFKLLVKKLFHVELLVYLYLLFLVADKLPP